MALTVKTDDVVRGRKDVDPHGQFRGKWVKEWSQNECDYLVKYMFKNFSIVYSKGTFHFLSTFPPQGWFTPSDFSFQRALQIPAIFRGVLI